MTTTSRSNTFPRTFHRHRVVRWLFAFAWLCLASASLRAQVPDSFRGLVLGVSKRPIVDIELAGESFHGMAVFSESPYLVWADAKALGPSHDREATRAWLKRVGPALGWRDFEPIDQETFPWRDDEVWKFGLVRSGIALHDAKIEVHWRSGRFVGFVNAVPLPLLDPEAPAGDVARDGSTVYLPERESAGYRPVLRRVEIARQGGLLVTTIGTRTTVSSSTLPPPTPITPEQFKEWHVPIGTFPDQIDVDSTGKVWFSQPNDNKLTRFDPVTETFQQFTTTGGSGPDGMIVDSQDRVWTGLYYSGALGKLLPATGTHTSYPAPYGSAAMAIPVESRQGTVWVTDHQANRISEFDPVSSTWLGSYVMPTPGCWVVQGTEDPIQSTIYYTCYSANKLAYKPHGGAIQETVTPPFGPAFAVWVNGKVYYSLWADRSLGRYDPVSGQHVLFTFPIPNEVGGPIGATSDGRIVVGTRSQGYIMVFHPATSTFTYYKIPTVYQGNLKDGLTVGNSDDVWFTETGANKLARLLIH
jgi:streptogramin lyase